MYDFAIVALLALGTLKLVDFLIDLVPAIRQFRTLVTFVVAIAATVVLDYSLFSRWGIGIDNDSLGAWITGVMVAGLTVPWRALFSYLTHDQAERDETLGEHRPVARAA